MGLGIGDLGFVGMSSDEVVDGVLVLGDLPGGVEAAEGAGADLDAEFFVGEANGVEGAVLFVDEDELLFLVGSQAGEDGMDAAGAIWDWGLRIGDLGRGNLRFQIRNFRLGSGTLGLGGIGNWRLKICNWQFGSGRWRRNFLW